MAYAARQLHLVPTLVQVLGFLALCVAGIAIHYSLMFLLASISFWTVRAQGIVWGYYNLFNIARMPDEAFRRPVQGRVHLCPADAAGLQRAGAPAGRQAELARAGAAAAGHERRLLLRLRMGLARLRAPLHQRQFLSALRMP